MMKRELLFTWVLFLIFVHPAWALTPAGTVIQNQAAATVNGETYLSNVVETLVLPVCGVSLAPNGTISNPGQETKVGPGGEAYLFYELYNAGNDTFQFALDILRDASSSWVPEHAKLIQDVNRNGQVDPGEEAVSSLVLSPDASVALVLVVKAPLDGSGDLFITPSARCPTGEVDDQNYARVTLTNGPVLQAEKRVSPTEVLPGKALRVRIAVRNVGNEPAYGDVILSDDLSALGGLVYVAGSAYAPKGSVEYFDGSAWQTMEPSSVRSIRLRVSQLEVGEEATLEFSLYVPEGTRPQTLQNIARAEGPGGPAEAVAFLRVLPQNEFYLGPRGNPRAEPGGEGSEDDRQSRVGFGGQSVCFEHTLENATNVEDTFDLSVEALPAGVQAIFQTLSGTPLALPVTLGPASLFDFRVCFALPPQGVPPFTAAVKAVSQTTQEENRTYDEVPEVFPADMLVLSKEVSPEGTVSAGEELEYTLVVRNGYPVDLHNVAIKDRLSEDVEYLASSPEGEFDPAKHTVIWYLGKLSAGETWQAKLRVRVKRNAPDDTEILNEFRIASDELVEGVTSPKVENRVWSTSILIEKSVQPQRVRVGGLLTYRIVLKNPSRVDVTLDLVDTPPRGLRYQKGSAKPEDPEIKDGKLIWRGISLGPGEERVFEYRMRVLAGASATLANVAQARGRSAGGAVVATGFVRALAEIEDPIFAERRATLIGRVFLDLNRNGIYEEDFDHPLPGARLVLSNGMQAVTDAEGRYAFRDLAPGVWLLKLDPASAPFGALPHPEALAEVCVHRVRVESLTVSDFPLAAPKGWIKGVRRTQLRMGPFLLEKRILPLTNGSYRVVLHLRASEPLPEFELRDPLPGGGEKRFTFKLFEGEKTLTYDLKDPVWLTDPEVRWRYP